MSEVKAAKESLREYSRGIINLNVSVSEYVANTLRSSTGLTLENNCVPMRWIKGEIQRPIQMLVYMHLNVTI